MELSAANIAEPLLYGSSTGLSPLSILVAAIFWAAVWGPVGLLVATPLTVCLIVLGKHVPQLQFLDVMLGDTPVLSPEARLYQRMLANDADEAVQVSLTFAQGKPLSELYDGLLIPALALAEQDRRVGGLPAPAQAAILEVTAEIVEATSEHEDPREAETSRKAEPPTDETVVAILSRKNAVLCLPAHSELDRAGAELVAHLLSRQRIVAGTRPYQAVSARNIAHLEPEGVWPVCLCSMTFNDLHARRLTRRFQAHFGAGTTILFAVWTGSRDEPVPERGGSAFAVVTSVADAVERIRKEAARAVVDVA